VNIHVEYRLNPIVGARHFLFFFIDILHHKPHLSSVFIASTNPP
jgi:hypothetical protein